MRKAELDWSPVGLSEEEEEDEEGAVGAVVVELTTAVLNGETVSVVAGPLNEVTKPEGALEELLLVVAAAEDGLVLEGEAEVALESVLGLELALEAGLELGLELEEAEPPADGEEEAEPEVDAVADEETIVPDELAVVEVALAVDDDERGWIACAAALVRHSRGGRGLLRQARCERDGLAQQRLCWCGDGWRQLPRRRHD